MNTSNLTIKTPVNEINQLVVINITLSWIG